MNNSMKVVLLAGGYGTRISEESQFKPKPMIEIGEKPILWHIMKIYAYYGFTDFIICAGYKQHMVKEWFADYFLHNSDITFDFSKGENNMIVHNQHCDPWKVTIVDTGLHTMTGGRIKRVQKYIGNETFMMTYGDAVCDVDIGKLVEFHRKHGKKATLTAVLQEQGKGILDIQRDGTVHSFREKKEMDGVPINAGYMVLEPSVLDLITDDMISLTDVGGWENLKINWDDGEGLVKCPNLTHQSCINVLNGLYDFVGNGSTETRTLKVHQNFLDTVGDEISIGTSKGWTITV